MPREIPPILKALAKKFRAAKAGREGMTADFGIDYRELLRFAKCEDGEARAEAEDALRVAAHESVGRLSLETHRRDPAMILRVKLSVVGGEDWLFERVGESSPTVKRQALADFFRHQAKRDVGVIWQTGWREWLQEISTRAMSGKRIGPFQADDEISNLELLEVAEAILHWPGESLIRYASSVICGDSKRLKILKPRVLEILQGVTARPRVNFQSFGILEKPRSVRIDGPLILEMETGRLDLGMLSGPVSLSGVDLAAARSIHSSVRVCLTVENEDVFCELAKQKRGVLLVHTSFPGSAARCLLSRLPEEISFYHFGDSDPAGFDILRDLRQKTGRGFKPVMMDFRPTKGGAVLSATDRQIIERLLADRAMEDVREPLENMLAAGSKGDFEQESIPPVALEAIWSLLDADSV
jgi:hypothetical protein